MLVLSRKIGEKIVIGDNIVITVTDCQGDRVKLGFECPVEVPIHRQEIYDRMCGERSAASAPTPAAVAQPAAKSFASAAL
jgi:carbon storage regulator